jgi:hypothetical protein
MREVPAGQVLVVYREAETPSQADVAWCQASGLFQRIAAYRSFVVFRRVGWEPGQDVSIRRPGG